MTPTIIIRDCEPEDFILAIRSAKYLLREFKKDAIVSYERLPGSTRPHDFYVRRNKSSITVRPTQPLPSPVDGAAT